MPTSELGQGSLSLPCSTAWHPQNSPRKTSSTFITSGMSCRALWGAGWGSVDSDSDFSASKISCGVCTVVTRAGKTYNELTEGWAIISLNCNLEPWIPFCELQEYEEQRHYYGHMDPRQLHALEHSQIWIYRKPQVRMLAMCWCRNKELQDLHKTSSVNAPAGVREGTPTPSWRTTGSQWC